jgi:hypothetical protein
MADDNSLTKDKKRNLPSRGFWIGILFANALLFAVIFDIIPDFIPFLEISKDDSSGGILLIPYFVFMLISGFVGAWLDKVLFHGRQIK